MAKTVKPSGYEKAKAEVQLMKKYPQMYASGTKDQYNNKPPMGYRVKQAIGKALGKKKQKPLTTKKTEKITSQLQQAGLSQKEIDKLRGKK